MLHLKWWLETKISVSQMKEIYLSDFLAVAGRRERRACRFERDSTITHRKKRLSAESRQAFLLSPQGREAFHIPRNNSDTHTN
jgi:hypothetical protein